MKAKKKETKQSTSLENADRPRGVPSRKYPGLIYLYPSEPSVIGEDKIEAAVEAAVTARLRREAAERAKKKQRR
jgi:hypothetical protein